MDAIRVEAANYNVNINQLPVSAHNLSPFNTVRVIFLLLGTELLNKVLCIAYSEGYFLPVYQFVMNVDETEPITSVEFEVASHSYNCSEKQVRELVEAAIHIEYQLERPDNNTITDSGISLLEFYDCYQKSDLHSINQTNTVNIYVQHFSMPLGHF